jgi:oligopeptide/dipeptide ABC transporter ATP-binding protein
MHPYSIALLSAIPVVDVDRKVTRIILKGDVPSPMNPKPGCRFAPRCWMAKPECSENDPPISEVEGGHHVACHFALESRGRMQSAETRSLK